MWIRSGKCNQCGKCCVMYCPYFSWVAGKDIKKGEIITETGIDKPIYSVCSIQHSIEKQDNSIFGGSCFTFPTDPFQTEQKCNYKWVEVPDNTVVEPGTTIFPPK